MLAMLLEVTWEWFETASQYEDIIATILSIRLC